MTYEPTEIDLAWTRQMIELIADGGVLAFPASGLIFRVRKEDKLLVLENSEILRNSDSLATYHRTIAVCQKLGWNVRIGV